MSPEDRVLLELFARWVRLSVPAAAVWAFGSRARGTPHPDSDLDLCVVVPQVTPEVRDAIHAAAWEIGFEHGCVLAPIIRVRGEFRARADVRQRAGGEYPP